MFTLHVSVVNAFTVSVCFFTNSITTCRNSLSHLDWQSPSVYLHLTWLRHSTDLESDYWPVSQLTQRFTDRTLDLGPDLQCLTINEMLAITAVWWNRCCEADKLNNLAEQLFTYCLWIQWITFRTLPSFVICMLLLFIKTKHILPRLRGFKPTRLNMPNKTP